MATNGDISTQLDQNRLKMLAQILQPLLPAAAPGGGQPPAAAGQPAAPSLPVPSPRAAGQVWREKPPVPISGFPGGGGGYQDRIQSTMDLFKQAESQIPEVAPAVTTHPSTSRLGRMFGLGAQDVLRDPQGNPVLIDPRINRPINVERDEQGNTHVFDQQSGQPVGVFEAGTPLDQRTARTVPVGYRTKGELIASFLDPLSQSLGAALLGPRYQRNQAFWGNLLMRGVPSAERYYELPQIKRAAVAQQQVERMKTAAELLGKMAPYARAAGSRTVWTADPRDPTRQVGWTSSPFGEMSPLMEPSGQQASRTLGRSFGTWRQLTDNEGNTYLYNATSGEERVAKWMPDPSNPGKYIAGWQTVVPPAAGAPPDTTQLPAPDVLGMMPPGGVPAGGALPPAMTTAAPAAAAPAEAGAAAPTAAAAAPAPTPAEASAAPAAAAPAAAAPYYDVSGLNLPTGDVPEYLLHAAQLQNVPPPLAIAVGQQESGLSQKARGASGEVGVMQLMPKTARDLGVDPNNVNENMEGGVRYIREAMDAYPGDLDKVLAYYNAGPPSVQNAIAKDPVNWRDQLPEQTRSYITGVRARIRRFGADPDAILTGGTTAAAGPAPAATVMVPGYEPEGLLVRGNTEILNRPVLRNPDVDGMRSTSTATTVSFNAGDSPRPEDRRLPRDAEILVPSVVNGVRLPVRIGRDGKPDYYGARDYYFKTGEHFGKFVNHDDADAYAHVLHNYQVTASGGTISAFDSPENQRRLAQKLTTGTEAPTAPPAGRPRIFGPGGPRQAAQTRSTWVEGMVPGHPEIQTRMAIGRDGQYTVPIMKPGTQTPETRQAPWSTARNNAELKNQLTEEGKNRQKAQLYDISNDFLEKYRNDPNAPKDPVEIYKSVMGGIQSYAAQTNSAYLKANMPDIQKMLYAQMLLRFKLTSAQREEMAMQQLLAVVGGGGDTSGSAEEAVPPTP
jgi:soluble lytic murein transglycosylase-like protein